MFEVMSRSPEAWGPLANISGPEFTAVLCNRRTRSIDNIKAIVARKKKLKSYKVTFIRELVSDSFEVEAENEYSVTSAARELFKSKQDEIEFKMKPVGKWAGDYTGYDRVMYTKVSK